MDLNNNNTIKLKALEGSHYCPPYKADNFIETFEIDNFDVEDIKDKVRKSVQLISYDNPYRELILEILDVLYLNKNDFLTDMHKYISFYWSGIPVLLLEVKEGKTVDKQLHISLQKYKTDKRDLIAEKKKDRMILGGLGATLFIGGIVVAKILFKNYVSEN